jgi:DNA replication protein DnaC
VVTPDDLCGDCDWFRRRDEAIREKANRESLQAWGELVESIGGEEELSKYTIESFKPFDERTKSALEAAKAFHPSTTSLYLTGIPGCGKTHLALGLAQKFFAEGKRVRYFKSGPCFARHFQMRDPDEEERRINAAARADILIINELGIGRDSEFRLQILQEVIDARDMLGRKGMIITSNLHPRDLEERTKDGRLRSRFEGGFKIILAGEKDYREIQRSRKTA